MRADLRTALGIFLVYMAGGASEDAALQYGAAISFVFWMLGAWVLFGVKRER